ncbi:MAG TPA: ribose 5-phosphate isomerase B [Clostridiales bacterium]|nr:ribose 5-phosphate isomerase B [Clostridiales bacterium]
MIVLGADHGGFIIKEAIKKYLDETNIEYIDIGSYNTESVDYPVYAKKLCSKIQDGTAELGILCCGTGIGMSMVANKQKGIRAAVLSDEFSCEFSRKHNNANVLCLGGRVVSNEKAMELAKLFLNTQFESGRHERRIAMFE